MGNVIWEDNFSHYGLLMMTNKPFMGRVCAFRVVSSGKDVEY